jgi:RND family efflux transporter MFP subunit
MTQRRRKIVLFSILSLSILISVVFMMEGGAVFRRHERASLPQEPLSPAPDPGVVLITTEPVTFRPVQRTVEAVGTLDGYEEVVISAKAEGRVRAILHDVADRVKPGTLLLEVDPTDAALAVDQAEKTLLVELARLGLQAPPGSSFDVNHVPSVMQALAQLNNAQQRMNRLQRLASTRAIATEELTDRTAEFQAAKADYEAQVLVAKTGLATVQMRQAALRAAQQQLKDTQVLAPIPTRPVPGTEQGVTYAITKRSVAEGTYVRPGSAVFSLVIDQTLTLRAPIPTRYSPDIHVGQHAEIYTAAYATPFSGTVARINPSVDPGTRTFAVDIQVPNPKGQLKPGSFAKTAILTRVDPEAAMVPLEAVVQFAGITKIFLVESGRAKEVPVTLGVESTTWYEIATPALPRDSQVITSGQAALADGTRVAVRSGADKAALAAGAAAGVPSRAVDAAATVVGVSKETSR